MFAKRRPSSDDYFVCPHCGAELPTSAKSCGHCGSDDETGWSDREWRDSGDAEDDEEYQEFLQREFPDSAKQPPHDIAWHWRLTAIVLLALLAYTVFRAW